MELSPKAIRFLIECVKLQILDYDHRLEEDRLSDDDVADLTNDRQFLRSLEQDLKNHHEHLVECKEPFHTAAN